LARKHFKISKFVKKKSCQNQNPSVALVEYTLRPHSLKSRPRQTGLRRSIRGGFERLAERTVLSAIFGAALSIGGPEGDAILISPSKRLQFHQTTVMTQSPRLWKPSRNSAKTISIPRTNTALLAVFIPAAR
jgi:hypothetical protein